MQRKHLAWCIVSVCCIQAALVTSLQNCPGSRYCADNSACTGPGKPCVCNSGFHEYNGSTCQRDVLPGGNCTLKGNDTECTSGATCSNVSPEGTTEVLQCRCKEDYHLKHDHGGSFCEEDVMPGGYCSLNSSEEECKNNSTCSQVTGEVTVQQCMCNEGFHMATTPGIVDCIADLHPGSVCTLPGNNSECVDNATCTNMTSTGEPLGTWQCQCISGFHEMNSNACRADVRPGGSCTLKGNDTECTSGATCFNVSPEGTTEVLQCRCKEDYHLKQDHGGSFCEEDVMPGGYCSLNNIEEECKNNSTCSQVTGEVTVEQCMCNEDFHFATRPDIVACIADLHPGSVCTLPGNNSECVDNATCTNMTSTGEALNTWQCQCISGFHKMNNKSCRADFQPGQVCSQNDSNHECVDNTTCRMSQVEGQPAELRCTCNNGFHEEDSDMGQKICVQDKCEDTEIKCTSAGMTSCEQVTDFIHCMLTGECQADRPEDVQRFQQAMAKARNSTTADCDFTSRDTCAENTTGCLNSYLKTAENCTSILRLENCLAQFNDTCFAANEFQLAGTRTPGPWETLSCACQTEAEACRNEAESMENLTKCNVSKMLFTCALGSSQCHLNRTVDRQVSGALWSQARMLAADSACEASIAEGEALTCPLQLTRCFFVNVSHPNVTTDDKTFQCKLAKKFNNCLTDNTTSCVGADRAKVDWLTAEYKAMGGNCTCIDHLTQCNSVVETLPADPVIACPLVVNFSLCALGAHCELMPDSDDLARLQTAHNWYSQHKAAGKCMVTSQGLSCKADVDVCSDQLITVLSKAGITAAESCGAVTNLILCLNAANCSANRAPDLALLTSPKEAAAFRLTSLSCAVPTCNKTRVELAACRGVFDAALTAAGGDSTRKCTVKNEMVKCLRQFQCNPYMKTIVQRMYDTLKAVSVPSCAMLSLEDTGSHDSAAASLSSLLIVSVSVISAVLSAWK